MTFFRDPVRIPGKGITAPADGRIIFISRIKPDITKTRIENGQQVKRSKPERIRIAIFMSVLNVHVNRAPIDGLVLSMVHKPGSFIPAYKQKSSQNERMVTSMKTTIGNIKIIQIAGLIAQRIIPYVQPGWYLNKGQRLGMIQFGSRVDLILPAKEIKVEVRVGDKVRAGTSTIAKIIRNVQN